MGLSGFFSQQATGNRINTAHMQMLKELLHVWGFFFCFVLLRIYTYMVIVHMRQFNHIIRNIIVIGINNFLTQFNGHMLSFTEYNVCYIFSYQCSPIWNILIKQFIWLCEAGFLKWWEWCVRLNMYQALLCWLRNSLFENEHENSISIKSSIPDHLILYPQEIYDK